MTSVRLLALAALLFLCQAFAGAADTAGVALVNDFAKRYNTKADSVIPLFAADGKVTTRLVQNGKVGSNSTISLADYKTALEKVAASGMPDQIMLADIKEAVEGEVTTVTATRQLGRNKMNLTWKLAKGDKGLQISEFITETLR